MAISNGFHFNIRMSFARLDALIIFTVALMVVVVSPNFSVSSNRLDSTRLDTIRNQILLTIFKSKLLFLFSECARSCLELALKQYLQRFRSEPVSQQAKRKIRSACLFVCSVNVYYGAAFRIFLAIHFFFFLFFYYFYFLLAALFFFHFVSVPTLIPSKLNVVRNIASLSTFNKKPIPYFCGTFSSESLTQLFFSLAPRFGVRYIYLCMYHGSAVNVIALRPAVSTCTRVQILFLFQILYESERKKSNLFPNEMELCFISRSHTQSHQPVTKNRDRARGTRE